MGRDEELEASEAPAERPERAGAERAERADRDAAIDRIVAIGGQTRKPPPRSLWIAAIVVGTFGVGGFTAAMLAEPEPASASRPASSVDSFGLGSGLLIGAAVGIVIGYSIARQRAD